MGDSFTNLLLVALITLLGYIGKVFYDKMEEALGKIEQILMDDVGQKKDIESIKEDVCDHETRITKLEER